MTEEKNNKTVEEVESKQTQVNESEKLTNEEEINSNDIETKVETIETDQLEKLEKENEELKNKVLRVQADYDNFRRRTREQTAAASKYKAQGLAEKLLPAIDSFERAMEVNVEGEEAKSLLKGLEIVQRQLKEAFEQENVKEIEALGESFDPEYHQAVMSVEDDQADSNTVIEVMQKGYVLNDRVLRPAMVKVSV